MKFYCMVCRRVVPELRVRRKSPYCSKECRGVSRRARRDWMAKRRCRLCGRAFRRRLERPARAGKGKGGRTGTVVEIRGCAPGAQGNLVSSDEWRVASGIGLARLWHWLTTTRYTRLLEERVARLEAENAHLRNAIYARAGVGPVPLGPAPPANAAGERRMSQPIRRPISWSQVKQKLESSAMTQPQGTSSPRGPSS